MSAETKYERGVRRAGEAYAMSAIEPRDLGPAINGLIYFFTVLIVIITGLRVAVRFSKSDQRFGWDDIIAVGALVSQNRNTVLGRNSTIESMVTLADHNGGSLGRSHSKQRFLSSFDLLLWPWLA